MLKQIILITLMTSLLFSMAYAMEPEDKSEYFYERNPNKWAIEDFSWQTNSKLDDSIDKSKALFYQKCAHQLFDPENASQENDPNCGLPQEIAQPFLTLCQKLIKGLKNRADQMCVIQTAASFNIAQVKALGQNDIRSLQQSAQCMLMSAKVKVWTESHAFLSSPRDSVEDKARKKLYTFLQAQITKRDS
jgi:hypothetical protein